jgi:hypothetical protein
VYCVILVASDAVGREGVPLDRLVRGIPIRAIGSGARSNTIASDQRITLI